MSGLPTAPPYGGSCPFCGVATNVPHETQEGCIAALHAEIGRMRGILANVKSTGVRRMAAPADDDRPPSVRLGLTKNDHR
jgi:hypothetical protein